jgi:hypothetical protein
MSFVYKFKKPLLIIIPIVLILSLFYVTIRPFTISCNIRIRIEKDDSSFLGSYNGEKISKLQNNEGYYIIVPNAPVINNKKVKTDTVKIKCSKKQFEAFDMFEEHYYNLLFESNRFNVKEAVLISIYE